MAAILSNFNLNFRVITNDNSIKSVSALQSSSQISIPNLQHQHYPPLFVPEVR